MERFAHHLAGDFGSDPAGCPAVSTSLMRPNRPSSMNSTTSRGPCRRRSPASVAANFF
jgi:hypothetical protein